jgi:transposase
MSASRKIIPKAKTHSKTPRYSASPRAKADKLFAEIDRLTEARDHWQKLYHLSSEKVQKLEGRLSLRDKEIADLKLELDKKKAYIKKLERKVFRQTSEQGPLDSDGSNSDPSGETSDDSTSNSAGTPEPDPTPTPPPNSSKRPRGKQPGSPGYGPKDHDGLPEDGEVTYDLDESCCPECGEQYREMAAEQSHTVEVSVRAYRRKHVRKKVGHFCTKKNKWVTKRAKGLQRLFRHSRYGISFWVFLLNGKFSLFIPVNRLCILLAQKGLDVSQGTIAGGFQRILRLIKPLIDEIKRYSREDKSHWHIDDTGWKVFVKTDGKDGYGWYLWVFKSDDVCVFTVSPSRSREVPRSHLKDSVGVVSCDRLPANKKINEFLIYAFCWVHERRHFRELHVGYPELRAICDIFLKLVADLFHCNRLRQLNEEGSTEWQAAECALSKVLDRIKMLSLEYLAKPQIHSELRRVLKGVISDWDGLYTFLELPHIPPDNNAAERAIRGPVKGRKDFYGSGSKDSAELTAAMFSLDATLQLNNMNLEAFMTEYLEACAANGGNPPSNAISFLPWHRKPPPAD